MAPTDRLFPADRRLAGKLLASEDQSLNPQVPASLPHQCLCPSRIVAVVPSVLVHCHRMFLLPHYLKCPHPAPAVTRLSRYRQMMYPFRHPLNHPKQTMADRRELHLLLAAPLPGVSGLALGCQKTHWNPHSLHLQLGQMF